MAQLVFYPPSCSNDAQTLKKMHLLSPAPSSLPCLDDVKTNKQEGTLASYMKRKKTSSKIVVWCVRCPQGTVWQVHRRVAQHSPSRNLHPPPTHPTRPQTLMYHRSRGKQASKAKPSQAKPHQKHTRRRQTAPQNRRHLPPPAASSILQQCLGPTGLRLPPNNMFKRCTDIEEDASSIPSTILLAMP